MLKLKLKNMDLDQLNYEQLEALIDEMLNHIGATDPELRDQLIYPTFIKIISDNRLSDLQYQHILATCLDDKHLFYKIGEKHTDAVFTRSFSSLVITALIHQDRDTGVLSKDDIKTVYHKTITYLKHEQDTRGYVPGKGWAHSIAHGADLLASLAAHPKINLDTYIETLDTIQHCLFKDATYIDEEDERLIFVIEVLVEKGLSDRHLEQWVLQLFKQLELMYTDNGPSNHYYRTKFTITTFVKSLYFRLGFKYNTSRTRRLINDQLKQLHQQTYGV
ncbi:DUF2785 domain-containing protein [Lentibacillus saliphilus]|uniref:DUF2785 domain-containing protein n=1 Tax=Lentibacillus saliphilus TaxID=2737028 RepID=UPI001C3108D0|nr:DUF2785 domain-containing protein [Lentibacillus saliphilus]